ncbi:CDP-alcohol phosphatidyltransferase family protein [Albibacterium indicum]|uniref:CDP-alcohol phosphatidyltransferase family protein n=1 Tax=Albibacterium indicum TaxID=2292082 RepID=UPI000E538CA2|nr:CDP-alcohol phosphatidyltransferase family protein [Pedobacter indicus]
MESREQKSKNRNLFKDRKRTNILKDSEQKLILYLIKKVPGWVSPNMLTGIGIAGSVLIFLAFVLAYYVDTTFLLLGPFGFFVNWFGDSLDGRIAYFRKIPRKWYGFSLDIIMDWIGTVIIGLGYFVYADPGYEIVAFILVALYGWAMIISQLRYKISNVYAIDAGIVGPTEIRVIISLIILIELIFPHTIHYFISAICVILLLINIKDTNALLDLGDLRDLEEKK